jgi:hypothetical protein
MATANKETNNAARQAQSGALMDRRSFFGKTVPFVAGIAVLPFAACKKADNDMFVNMEDYVDLSKYRLVKREAVEVGQALTAGTVQIKLLAITVPKTGDPAVVVEVTGKKSKSPGIAQIFLGGELITEDANGKTYFIYCPEIKSQDVPATATFSVYEKK